MSGAFLFIIYLHYIYNICYIYIVMMLENKTIQELKMKKIHVLYKNTNIIVKAMGGYNSLIDSELNVDSGLSNCLWIDKNYSHVFFAEMPSDSFGNSEICESIYRKLNQISTQDLKDLTGYNATFLPSGVDFTTEGYIGHTSMSVGDIVVITDTETYKDNYYLCDSVGFKEITSLLN